MAFKVLTGLVLLNVLWRMGEIWQIGKQLAAGERSMLPAHRRAVCGVALFTGLAVLLIEFQVHTLPRSHGKDPLLWGFHLGMAGLLSVVFLAMVTRFTGLRSPQWHRKLARSFFGLYGAVILSGAVLLYRLP